MYDVYYAVHTHISGVGLLAHLLTIFYMVGHQLTRFEIGKNVNRNGWIRPPSRRRISELADEFCSPNISRKKSACRIRHRIFAAVNPPKTIRIILQIWRPYKGVTVDWRVSFRLLKSTSVVKICSSQSSKSDPKKRFCPLPVCGECPGKFGPNFHIAVISEYCVQVWLRSV